MFKKVYERLLLLLFFIVVSNPIKAREYPKDVYIGDSLIQDGSAVKHEHDGISSPYSNLTSIFFSSDVANKTSDSLPCIGIKVA
jgi:hypothetical protein